MKSQGFFLSVSGRKNIFNMLARALPKEFLQFQWREGEPTDWRLIDTFESHLGKKRQLLLQAGQMLRLIDLPSGLLLQQKARKNWRFAGDLSRGPVAEILANHTMLRAYMPVLSANGKQMIGVLLDDQQKTVARLHAFYLRIAHKQILVGITGPMRGYDEEHGQLCRTLQKSGGAMGDGLETVYPELGIPVSEYVAKPSLCLDPVAPALTSVSAIISVFLKIARENESGIIADFDTEFLHDYRVSLRKVRSALSLFQGVLAEEQVRRFKAEFAEIMQTTNRLRDLDVYLLAKDTFTRLVPEASSAGLPVLFSYLARERKKELKKVVKRLESEEYQQQMARLRAIFQSSDSLAPGPGGKNVFITYAAELILSKYRRVSKLGGNIDDSTPDEKVHKLRIQAKKLRYLLEFCGELFAGEEMKKLVKALKGLQDNLGNFNDYSVQQVFLKQLLGDNLQKFRGRELQLAETVGAATAVLHQLQREERGRVMANIGKFDSSETRETVMKVFGGETEG